jgi:hypothetical protein
LSRKPGSWITSNSDHALRGLFGGEARAEREAAADPLRDRHDVGGDAVEFMREELARPAIAALDLVEHQQQAVFVTGGAQPLQERVRRRAQAAFALDWLDQESRGMIVDQRQRGVEIVERRIAEARQQGFEPVTHLRLVGRRDRSQRPAVKGVAEGDQVLALRIAVGEVVTTRGLDRALDRLGTRIGEEHGIGEGRVDQSLRELLALRAAIEVRHVH